MNAVSEPFDLAIVGAGAGGTLAAIHALRNAKAGQRIVLIETGAYLGEGAAYSTRQKELVLNVPARGMSAFADAPQDFLDYACKHDNEGTAREELANSFAQRRRYADYLRARLLQARALGTARLLEVHACVMALEPAETGVLRIALASGIELQARNLVLASGNHPRALQVAGGENLTPVQCIDAWDYRVIARIPVDAEVCIVGAGLSMADSVQSLRAHGHRGRIHAVSRHALLPLAHAAQAAVHEFDVAALHALPLRRRMRAIRAHVRDAQAAGLPWQSVFERLRPHGQALWQSLAFADQRRFLRHVVRYWDIHRHRIAPHVQAQLQALLDDEQLCVHRARLEHVAARRDGVYLRLRLPDGATQDLDAGVVINATGVEHDMEKTRNPLLAQLLAQGLARRGPHGLGLDTATDGTLLDAHGTPQPCIRVIGSPRIGTLWETTAIPELRVQAEAAVKALLNA